MTALYAHMNPAPADYRQHLQDAIAAPITSRLASTLASRITLDHDAAARAVRVEFGDDDAAADATATADAPPSTSPAHAETRVRRSASAPPSSAAADAEPSDANVNAGDSDDSDADDPDSFLCDAGPLLSGVALLAGAHVACPFTANGIEVHYPGILGARRTSDMHWKVAFYDGDAWFVRRDRLFAVVDLAAA